jgi:hypothetical protein
MREGRLEEPFPSNDSNGLVVVPTTGPTTAIRISYCSDERDPRRGVMNTNLPLRRLLTAGDLFRSFGDEAP